MRRVMAMGFLSHKSKKNCDVLTVVNSSMRNVKTPSCGDSGMEAAAGIAL